MDDTSAPDHSENHEEVVDAATGASATEAAALSAVSDDHAVASGDSDELVAPWEDAGRAGAAVVPLYPDHTGGDSDWTGGIILAVALVAAAIASVFFLYNAEPTDDSTLVALGDAATASATATAIPATAVPTATPQAPAPTAVAAPAASFLLSDLAGGDTRLGQLSGALAANGLVGVLAGDGPLTVFAPTDEAFAAFSERTADLGLSDDQVEAILANHVVDGLHPSTELNVGTSLTSLAGSALTVRTDSSINGASVIEADLAADNGLAHIVDSVIVPLEVLNLRQRLSITTGVDTANELFVTTGVTSTLESEGPITVFVPSDFAVGGASPESLELVLANADPVTRYHVVEGRVAAADLTPGTVLVTLQGERILISEGPTLNGSISVVTADIAASNGLAHIINGVLVPGTLATEAALNALFVLEPVQFAVGSAEILPQSQLTLDEAVAVLLANPVGDVTIAGHTDTDGGADGNLALSQARAESVRAYLTNGGVNAERLTAIGFGETDLKIDPEVTPEDKAENRRIEFLVE